MFLRLLHTSSQNYPAPRGNVLLLSCMDLRLLDEIVVFMNGDNLTNRYDHTVLAGAALGVLQTKYPEWRQVFFKHIDLAVALHSIQDVYILEHRCCGAYAYFLGSKHNYGESPEEQAREEMEHRKQAFRLKKEILKYAKQKQKTEANANDWKLNVRCFLMDLRGAVHYMSETPEANPTDATT